MSWFSNFIGELKQVHAERTALHREGELAVRRSILLAFREMPADVEERKSIVISKYQQETAGPGQPDRPAPGTAQQWADQYGIGEWFRDWLRRQ